MLRINADKLQALTGLNTINPVELLKVLQVITESKKPRQAVKKIKAILQAVEIEK